MGMATDPVCEAGAGGPSWHRNQAPAFFSGGSGKHPQREASEWANLPHVVGLPRDVLTGKREATLPTGEATADLSAATAGDRVEGR